MQMHPVKPAPPLGFATFYMYLEFVSMLASSWSFPCLESCRSVERTCSMSWSFTCFTGVCPRTYPEFAALQAEPKAIREWYFGTPRLLKCMPGKPGMSRCCLLDCAIAALPGLHSCAANNPSEATIAERRAYAPAFVCSTHPVENAGQYGRQRERSERVTYPGMHEYLQR